MVRKWGPFKDGISVYYHSIHRNKRSLAFNFRDPRGLELIRELADRADILIENFEPAMRLGASRASSVAVGFYAQMSYSLVSF